VSWRHPELAGRLDAAYTGLAARLGPPEQRTKESAVRLQPGADGRVWLHLTPLDATTSQRQPPG